MEQIEYGEIKNLNAKNDNSYINRNGDYGEDKDHNKFCFLCGNWEPCNPDNYAAKYWKKKYEDLLKQINGNTNNILL